MSAFCTFPGCRVDGWMAGWGKLIIKLISVQLGLSLEISGIIHQYNYTLKARADGLAKHGDD